MKIVKNGSNSTNEDLNISHFDAGLRRFGESTTTQLAFYRTAQLSDLAVRLIKLG